MDFEIYCDESRTEYFYKRNADSEHYVIIGGIWIEANKRQEYKAEIKSLRDIHDIYGEFKWNRVSPSRLPFYIALVRFFSKELIRFRSIVLPANQLDVVRFHEADHELMFYKFYYQLLHHWILDFNRYRIFVDFKSNRLGTRLRTLEKVLQKSNLTSEVLSVQALPSHESDLLQLADVLIGAVGYRFHHQKGSVAKLAVLNEIESCLGHQIQPTPRREDKFNIFRFRPGGGW